MGTARSLLSALSVCGIALASNSALAQASQSNETVFERPRADYDAKGLPAGGFRIHPSIDVVGEHDDNIFATEQDTVSDYITRVKPALTIESDWSRHALGLSASADSAFYSENQDEDHTNYNVGINGRLDVLRETYLFLSASHALLHEDRGDPNAAGAITEPTEYEVNNANISLFRGLRRFSFKLDGDYTEQDYEDDLQNNGGINDNDDRDRYKAEGSLRVGYEILPDYEAFVRGATNVIEYDEAINNGQDRDSDGYEVEAGIALDLGGKTRGEISAGYMEQQYNDPALSDVDDFTVGASLIWNPTQLTSLRLDADRTIEETVINGASAYVNSSVSFAVEHELLRNVLIGANASYALHEYEGIGITREDDYIGAGAEITYLINRYLEVGLDYNYLERDSNQTGQDYDRNRVMASIGLKF